MSDKETAPISNEFASIPMVVNRVDGSPDSFGIRRFRNERDGVYTAEYWNVEGWTAFCYVFKDKKLADSVCELLRVAAECTAPAPQLDYNRYCIDIQKHIKAELEELLAINGPGVLAQRIDELSRQIALLEKIGAATPQVTPWKSHFTDSDVTGDIHNYVDTGDGKRLWAQDADEIVKRHNEGTSERKEKP